MHTTRLLAFVLLLSLGSMAALRADNWPQWRGPGGKGVSPERGLPERWSGSEGIAWKTDLRGLGASSPIVWGDRVFVTSQIGNGPLTNAPHPPLVGVRVPGEIIGQPGPNEKPIGGQLGRQSSSLTFVVAAFNRADGRQAWEYTLPAQPRIDKNKNTWLPGVHELHNLSSASPVTDGERIYSLFGDGQLVVLDLDGKLVWRRNIAQDYGSFEVIWGHGSSPVLYEDTVILLCDHESVAYLVALDKRTGQERWKVDRPEGIRSYSTPAVVPSASGDELIISSSVNIDAYNPKTGEWLWKTGDANEFPVPFPTHHDGITYAISGPHRNGSYMAIRAGGRGDITRTHVVWRVAAGGPHVASPLLYDGLLYLTHENGVITCVDGKTGERVWQGRTSGLFTASPVGADGKVYAVSQTGETFVLKAGRTFEILTTNSLDERLMASPAISGGQIFLRSDSRLIAIGKPQTP
jgi:outer membrane protein assembly factor BamB